MGEGHDLRVALFEPDQPGNAGTVIRTGACLGVGIEVIEPCGFSLTDKALMRAGMDYLRPDAWTRHDDWNAFERWARAEHRRVVLATVSAAKPYTSFDWQARDVVLLGRESAGVPPYVHEAADARVFIPMVPGMRSINVAVAASILMGEALRTVHVG